MGLCGHTGLVVSMDDDGTIQTLESAVASVTPKTYHGFRHAPAATWDGNAEFVCLGDYMK